MSNALLVIDAQESFRQRDSWRQIARVPIAENIGRLVEHARAEGDPVFWILHTEPGTGNAFDPENGFVRTLEGLDPADGEPVLTKTSHNAFTTTNLSPMLTRGGVTSLTVSGIRTEQCCETTARLASDLGYAVTFAIDATATNDIELSDGSRLAAEDVKERTRFALEGRFATIRTVSQIVP
ncbi:cysteine hydrolase family protein [Salininema proteolyticum]|uniref:Cysteine hydrolase family protein n=1 Tax=Salininema proteolyticum TaxID=1607685 RepID=A0ABV8TXG8_9ACTN